MNQHSDAERQAGTLILSQLKMFNEAVVYFEQHLSPAFWKSFDQCIERFMKDNNWAGKANYEHQDYCWLSHPGWVIEGVNCKYWFENSSTVSDGADYILAVLTDTGTEQGQFGFEFKLNTGYFGGVKKIASYANNIQQSYRKQLQDLGFLDQGKGNYFLPVTIEYNLLTECWKEYGEFPVENEVFSPLRAALETLLRSTKVLDAIFSSEQQSSEDELVG
ncbi:MULTISPECIES: hypothetical protein [Pectobacterium]|uniref:hypothetical protein n=1 Tax=Pectobacterium TaxID=122277 RepID=UPI000D1AA632|nr:MULTISPECIES: hypothetical protein [Pectobacterium]AVT60023.1 hypothetical protein OA04_35300 [Pectobacterium versatile]MCH5049258.1 hypothetical protein [Pectobacterium aquaticum]GBO50309.1 hypothetical protein MFFDBJGM_03333 [Pectobacterium versatile]